MNGIYDTSRFTFRLWDRKHTEPYHYMTLGAWANRFDTTIRLGLKEITNGDSIMDVGCAIGVIPLCLGINLPKSKITCVDVSATPTARLLVDYFPTVASRVTFVKSDICKLNLKADWVLCTEVLEHVKDDKLAIKKLYESANKGVVITTPNELSNQKVDEHLRTYTMAAFKTLLKTVTANYKVFTEENLFHCNIGVIYK